MQHLVRRGKAEKSNAASHGLLVGAAPEETSIAQSFWESNSARSLGAPTGEEKHARKRSCPTRQRRRSTPPCLAQTPRRHAEKRGAHLIGAGMFRLPAHAGTTGLARLERGGHLRTPSRKKMTAYPLRPIGKAACGVTTPNGECSPCSTSSDEGKQKRATQQATVSWSALHPKRPSSGLCGGFSRERSFQVAIKVPQPIMMESDRNRKRRLVGAGGTFR